MDLHLLCRGMDNLHPIEELRLWQTGVWLVPARHAQAARWVWLHHAQDATSHHGGRILDVRPATVEDAPERVPHDLRGRWTFVYELDQGRMREAAAPRPWQGFAWTVSRAAPQPLSSSAPSRARLPPTAAVLTVSVRSVTKRSR